jgi:hypothetical protein
MSAFRCWIDMLPDVNTMISDVSDAGAVVTLDSAAKLPKTFVVCLTKSGSVGRTAEVTWRGRSRLACVSPARPRGRTILFSSEPDAADHCASPIGGDAAR